MLVSSRSLAEYRAMFALTDSDLRRRILDCPGGTASFTAEVNDAGGDVTACDPIYAQHTPDELAALSVSETRRGNRYVRAHPQQYQWNFFPDPGVHLHVREAAGARFAAGMRRHPDRYIAGRLPGLPFAAVSFDLVLSSHLLFSYADRLDLAFHRAAIGELVRVAYGELRIFPPVAMGSAQPYPLLGGIARPAFRGWSDRASRHGGLRISGRWQPDAGLPAHHRELPHREVTHVAR
jgi:SAM-dependent methyltransferase